MPPKIRTIVEQEFATAGIERARREHPKFDKVFNGIIWWLARKPLCGKRVPESNPPLFVLRTNPCLPLRVPAVRVLYSVNEHEVIIRAIAIYEDDGGGMKPSPEDVVRHMLNTPPPKKGKDEKEKPAK